MPEAKNVVLTYVNDVHISRAMLVKWVNGLLHSNIKAVEGMRSGIEYCQLIYKLFPNEVPIKKLKMNCTFESHYLKNFKILQEVFQKLKVNKIIPVSDLIKGNAYVHFSFLKWLKLFYEANCSEEMRESSECILLKVDDSLQSAITTEAKVANSASDIKLVDADEDNLNTDIALQSFLSGMKCTQAKITKQVPDRVRVESVKDKLDTNIELPLLRHFVGQNKSIYKLNKTQSDFASKVKFTEATLKRQNTMLFFGIDKTSRYPSIKHQSSRHFGIENKSIRTLNTLENPPQSYLRFGTNETNRYRGVGRNLIINGIRQYRPEDFTGVPFNLIRFGSENLLPFKKINHQSKSNFNDLSEVSLFDRIKELKDNLNKLIVKSVSIGRKRKLYYSRLHHVNEFLAKQSDVINPLLANEIRYILYTTDTGKYVYGIIPTKF